MTNVIILRWETLLSFKDDDDEGIHGKGKE